MILIRAEFSLRCICLVLILMAMSLNISSLGGQSSAGRVSMPSATMTCTVCSLAVRRMDFQSTSP